MGWGTGRGRGRGKGSGQGRGMGRGWDMDKDRDRDRGKGGEVPTFQASDIDTCIAGNRTWLYPLPQSQKYSVVIIVRTAIV